MLITVEGLRCDPPGVIGTITVLAFGAIFAFQTYGFIGKGASVIEPQVGIFWLVKDQLLIDSVRALLIKG